MLFRCWGLTLRATWIWLKVAGAGAPVCPVDSPHRKPYELLLIASAPGPAAMPADYPPAPRAAGTKFQATAGVGAECRSTSPLAPLPQSVPLHKVFVTAVAQHSRKPRLGRLLQPYVPPAARRLELFGRELEAGWVTWGNEALLFQCASLYHRADTE